MREFFLTVGLVCLFVIYGIAQTGTGLSVGITKLLPQNMHIISGEEAYNSSHKLFSGYQIELSRKLWMKEKYEIQLGFRYNYTNSFLKESLYKVDNRFEKRKFTTGISAEYVTYTLRPRINYFVRGNGESPFQIAAVASIGLGHRNIAYNFNQRIGYSGGSFPDTLIIETRSQYNPAFFNIVEGEVGCSFRFTNNRGDQWEIYPGFSFDFKTFQEVWIVANRTENGTQIQNPSINKFRLRNNLLFLSVGYHFAKRIKS